MSVFGGVVIRRPFKVLIASRSHYLPSEKEQGELCTACLP